MPSPQAGEKMYSILFPLFCMECGSCNAEITQCPGCGGNTCVPGCPDRFEDGCKCTGGADIATDEGGNEE